MLYLYIPTFFCRVLKNTQGGGAIILYICAILILYTALCSFMCACAESLLLLLNVCELFSELCGKKQNTAGGARRPPPAPEHARRITQPQWRHRPGMNNEKARLNKDYR